jgi:succinate dehydrogenase / fumarate reductase iron-sulfur subunit
MLVNGRPRQACSTLVRDLTGGGGGTITLEPLRKFPVVRDLIVDRTRMFEGLLHVRAWNPIDGTHDLGPAPQRSREEQAFAYALSRCMTCGCCMEACPQFGPGVPFLGPAPLGQAALFGLNPVGRMNEAERLDRVMGVGGITDCGNAQNCVEVCPKEVPLTGALAVLHRSTTRRWLARLLGR